ncbi:MAG: 30S ribosomal protein S2 [Planctomycetota bacterium]
MPIITMRELLEAGVHYGHHTSRWNPKMGRYIYKRRHSIHIIDLRETVRGLVRAHRYLGAVCAEGAEILLVGTKRQAEDTVREQGKRAGIHYVAERWLGGTLTNFEVVMGRMKRLDELEELDRTGEIEAKGKKFASVLRRELSKLRKNLGGIRYMREVPDVMIVIDPRHERNAVREAHALDIPVIALLDTDSDPDMIDIPIPGNDDAMRAVQLIASKLMDAVLEGQAQIPEVAGEPVGAPADQAPPETAAPHETPPEPAEEAAAQPAAAETSAETSAETATETATQTAPDEPAAPAAEPTEEPEPAARPAAEPEPAEPPEPPAEPENESEPGTPA